MARAAIETLLHVMDVAYLADPFSALRKNLDGITVAEWDTRPARWSVDEFGAQPELSICDLVLHVAGAKFMYADRAFSSATLDWADIKLPASRAMAPVLAWLDDGHRALTGGLAALTDDRQLDEERMFPRRPPTTRRQLITIMISHDLYHSGEINRQRALIRGAEGWDRRAGT